MARCSRRAMRPAAVMGAFYRAMLDALVAFGMARPEPPHQPVEAAEAVAGAAPRAFMTAQSHSDGTGACRRGRACRARRCRRACRRRAPGRALRSGRACGRALPLVFRCRARRPHRQRQPPAALRQSGGARLYRADRRARYVRAAGRGGDPVRRSRGRRRAGRCGRRAAACRGGFFARRGGCRERGHATISPRCGCGEPAPATLSRRCWIATRCCFAGYGSRSPSRRSTPRPSRLRPRFSRASSPRRSAAARPPAGRCCRARDCRESLVDPALDYLSRHGAEIRFGAG